MKKRASVGEAENVRKGRVKRRPDFRVRAFKGAELAFVSVWLSQENLHVHLRVDVDNKLNTSRAPA